MTIPARFGWGRRFYSRRQGSIKVDLCPISSLIDAFIKTMGGSGEEGSMYLGMRGDHADGTGRVRKKMPGFSSVGRSIDSILAPGVENLGKGGINGDRHNEVTRKSVRLPLPG